MSVARCFVPPTGLTLGIINALFPPIIRLSCPVVFFTKPIIPRFPIVITLIPTKVFTTWIFALSSFDFHTPIITCGGIGCQWDKGEQRCSIPCRPCYSLGVIATPLISYLKSAYDFPPTTVKQKSLPHWAREELLSSICPIDSDYFHFNLMKM